MRPIGDRADAWNNFESAGRVKSGKIKKIPKHQPAAIMFFGRRYIAAAQE
jgi:hypothetical protein